jgi:hypothetical protein
MPLPFASIGPLRLRSRLVLTFQVLLEYDKSRWHLLRPCYH